MAFDEALAERIRTTLARKKGLEEKKMFGGVVFMLHGNILPVSGATVRRLSRCSG